MDKELLNVLIGAAMSGTITGLMCWGALRQDVKWLKESVTEIRTLFFKYVQEENTRHGKC